MSFAFPPLLTVLGVAIGYALGSMLACLVGLPKSVIPLFPIAGGAIGFIGWYLSDLPVTTGGPL